MTVLRRAPGVLVALALMSAMIWASSAPITVHGSNDAVLRLAWSSRPERVEECRQRSDEELAKLPQHMRQPLVCEGVSAQYRLTVRYEGALVSEQLLHGGGLRQDRRLYVFHDIRLRPGEGAIEVHFDRLGGDTPAAASVRRDDARGAGGRAEPRGETVPPHLSLAQRLRIRPREVVLVTYAPDRQALVAVQDAPPARQ